MQSPQRQIRNTRSVKKPPKVPSHPTTSTITPLQPPPRELQRNIQNRSTHPKHDQRNANPLTKHPLVQRYENQQPHQRNKQRDPRNNQRPPHLDLIRLILELRARVFVLVVVRARDEDVRTAQPDAEQDVEHGPAEARGQRHHRVAELGDGDVGDEVAEGVADGEDGEAHDGVAHVADHRERFEGADDLGGDGGDPGDGDDEAGAGEQGAEEGWAVGCGCGEEERD